MPANSSLTLTSLDFDTLKQGFIGWLQNQTIFKDYNFNSSSMNVLLDVMAYNSYLNSFYLNMTFAEMFLDTAQKMDSVVSHVKELNYLPRSAASSEAIISFNVDTIGIFNPFSIPKGTTFVGKNSNATFTFTTDETTNYLSTNSSYTVSNLVIYEGIFYTDSFIVNTSNNIPNSCMTFLLTNQNVDLSSLSVTVIQDNGANSKVWTEVDNLYNLDGNSAVYFVQAAQDLQYEILFGDGLFGAIPQNGAVVQANYRIATGPSSDGVGTFQCTMSLGTINGGTATVSPITTNVLSQNGQLQQDIESIRFAAPRYYATQNRGVSSSDYEALILDQFGGLIKEVIAYGGENLSPPQYGTVVLCIKPTTGTIASDTLKNNILTFLYPLIALPMKVTITDPEYFYCKVDTYVTFDTTQTGISNNTLQTSIMQQIINYNSNNLGTFADNFRYSQFTHQIDLADPSVLSNNTAVYMVKRFVPVINFPFSAVFNFNNAAKNISTDPVISRDRITPIAQFAGQPVVWSTPFTYIDVTGAQWPISIIRDDNLGNLIVMTTVNGIITILNPSIGSVNYDTGVISITNFQAINYGQYVSLYLETEAYDFGVVNEQIILIDPADVSIQVVAFTPS